VDRFAGGPKSFLTELLRCLSPEPFVGLAPQSLLGPGSRHCYGIITLIFRFQPKRFDVKRIESSRNLSVKACFRQLAGSLTLYFRCLWQTLPHIERTKHAEQKGCVRVAASRRVSARTLKQSVRVTTWHASTRPCSIETNQNLSGRRNIVENERGLRGILSVKIVPNTGLD
jgi:hypothetical protein